MKQTILIVHNYYQIPGGEDTVVANEKKMLEDNGHKVVLYTRNNCELKNMGLLRKLLLPFTTIYNPRTARDIKRIIKKENIDIVHVHNTLNLISPAVYYAAKKMNVPVVQTIHNFRLLCPGATFYSAGNICEKCLSEGMLCAVCNKCYRNSMLQTLCVAISNKLNNAFGIYKYINLICLTNFTKQYFVNTKFQQEDNIFVKPNFCPDYGGRSSCDKHYFVFLGRIEEIKGVELTIDAFKQICGEKLLVLGDGPLLSSLELKIKKEKIDNVYLKGRVSHERAIEYIKGAKALIMSSQWYETFGMVIVEAYACGIPVVVGEIGNIKDLVVNAQTGFLFKYNSVESLREAILRILSDDINRLGTNAYDYYLDNYTEEKNYLLLQAIYDSLRKEN